LIASPVRASPRVKVDDLDGLFARLDRAAVVVPHSVPLLAGGGVIEAAADCLEGAGGGDTRHTSGFGLNAARTLKGYAD
jgi:hypothetical protein